MGVKMRADHKKGSWAKQMRLGMGVSKTQGSNKDPKTGELVKRNPNL